MFSERFGYRKTLDNNFANQLAIVTFVKAIKFQKVLSLKCLRNVYNSRQILTLNQVESQALIFYSQVTAKLHSSYTKTNGRIFCQGRQRMCWNRWRELWYGNQVSVG